MRGVCCLLLAALCWLFSACRFLGQRFVDDLVEVRSRRRAQHDPAVNEAGRGARYAELLALVTTCLDARQRGFGIDTRSQPQAVDSGLFAVLEHQVTNARAGDRALV